ncbi:alpha/beta hydrolase family protein [Wenyingzhuangia sp. IMCC45467]
MLNTSPTFKVYILTIFIFVFSTSSWASLHGTWKSIAIDKEINYKITDAKNPILDFYQQPMTVVYLENLGFKKNGNNTNKQDVTWLLSNGYRVIELDYNHNTCAVSPKINVDIIAINNAMASNNFCGLDNFSNIRSYILFEGYRIARDVPYFKDNPKIYNRPKEYIDGDLLYMDIIYPSNPKTKVPVILSFSYANSYATYNSDLKKLTDANKHQRQNLSYTLAGFNDSFLEGAPANGFAWAIADHPKYCSWGSGKPENGKNDTYKSYQTNPDTAQKVKSAVRTLRALGSSLNLSDKIGIYGFSRGSTAGSMAIGDKSVSAFENTGYHIGISDRVQAAALGPGIFDYTIIYNTLNDGDKNLELRCPWAWGNLKENLAFWKTMGAEYLIETTNTTPVLFFHNTDDSPDYLVQYQYLKSKLDRLNIPNKTLVNYGKGHAVPQKTKDLKKMYAFFQKHLNATNFN